MSENSFSPPRSIKHDDWVAALRPILELCGTTPEEVYDGIHFEPHTRADGHDDVLRTIKFNSAVDPQDGTEPVMLGDDPKWTRQAWPIAIPVI